MSKQTIVIIVIVIVVLCCCLALCAASLASGYFFFASRSVAAVTPIYLVPTPVLVMPTMPPAPTEPPPLPQATPAPTATTAYTGGEALFELSDPFMEDDRVGEIKFRLMELGYEICTVTSAFYNYQAVAAVRHFQAVNGLTANGIVGTDTWDALFSDSAVPAPPVDAPQANVETLFPVSEGIALATDGESLWIMDAGGLFNIFSLSDGEFGGFFMVEGLPGEEAYQPSAFFFDSPYLWIAQQGETDGLLQAYDPSDASPVEGLFKPVFNESAHFPSQSLYRTMTFDGGRFWVVAEDLSNQQVLLQPVDANSRAAGDPLRLGMSSGYGYSYALAFDERSGLLWAIYADEIFGEYAVVSVNPETGEVGRAIGPCGQQMAFDGAYLWIAAETSGILQAVDPASGEVVAQVFLDGMITAMVSDGEQLWILDAGGMLSVVSVP